ncbi:acetyl-synthetase-like protein [Neofusicoccum parvum]|uniref:Acetyl-synthetase-like protein n=1 Tax=Neofusicoccum parvum TaxID=310453 RepID=A0ACB5SG23_9PEZI|nr:acetyl-synthetase-like protein [Neofusicoccum parvum]
MIRNSGESHPLPAYGRRLIASTIDSLAKDSPERTYASVPISDEDLTRGFRDITYAQLAAAVDRTAYWLDTHLPSHPPTNNVVDTENGTHQNDGTREKVQTFAYYGPRDLRYILMVVAAMKTGRRVLMTSLLGSLEAQVYMAKKMGCLVFLYAAGGPDVVPSHVRIIPESVDGSVSISVPEFSDLFCLDNDHNSSKPYPYHKTWEEAHLDEVAIYHTSGSSGFPKLIPQTNEMLARLDSWNLLEDVNGMTTSREYYASKRLYIALPIFHLAGTLITLPCALFLHTIPVLGPATLPPSPPLFTRIHAHASPPLTGLFAPPSLLEDLVRHHDAAPLASLSTLIFAGAPLAPAAGNALAPLGSLCTCVGSTEGSYWPLLRPRRAADWPYVAPHPAMGAVFEPRADGLCELVVVRTPASEACTNFFCGEGAGGREVWRTRDLWEGHPEGGGLWRYRGRVDDLVVLSGEVKMYAGAVEERVGGRGAVRAALVGGDGRRVPFLLVEGVDGEEGEDDDDERERRVLEEVWPYVEEANEDVGPKTKLRRGLMLVARRDKPFARTAKGSVDRRNTFRAYEKEVDALYEKFYADGGEEVNSSEL